MLSKQLAIKEAHRQPQQITLNVSKIDHPFLLHPSTTTVLGYLIQYASEHEGRLLKGRLRLTTEHPEPTTPEDSTCLSGSSIAPLHPSSSPSSSSGKFHSAINSSSAQPKCASLDLLLNTNSVNPSPPVAVTSENFLHNNRTNIAILGISESWLKNYIKDGQIHIGDFVLVRREYSIKTGCGTLLYIHQKFLSLMKITMMMRPAGHPYAFCKLIPPS